MDFKFGKELIKAVYEIVKAIKGESQESGGKEEHFKMINAPVALCVIDDINEGTVTAFIPIEEFWNKYIIGEEELTYTDLYFVYDGIPDERDCVYLASGDMAGGKSFNMEFCDKNNIPVTWYYKELADYPGKYVGFFGG